MMCRRRRLPLFTAFFLPTLVAAATAQSEFDAELRTPRDMPVLAINYLAVGVSIPKTEILRGDENLGYRGKARIDCEETEICKESLPQYLKNLHNGALRTAEFMTDATRHHGYRDKSAPPALRYRVVDHWTVLQKKDDKQASAWATGSGKSLGYANNGMIHGYLRGDDRRNDQYRHPTSYLFDTLDVCAQVKDQGIRMIYFSSYHSKRATPAESFSAGPYGNVGNSSGNLGVYCRNGKPVFAGRQKNSDVTYHVMGYSPASGKVPTDNTIHNFGHHLEALFRYADRSLWGKVVGPNGHVDRTKVFPGMPGVERGRVFDQDDAVKRFGVKVEVLEQKRDRSVRLRIDQARTLPARPSFPGQKVPRQVAIGKECTVQNDETVAIAGKDVQFKYWENGKKAKFTMYRPSADASVVRRCGKTHYPPNAETDYDFQNKGFAVLTDCEEWTPDMSGTVLPGVTCQHWAGRTCNDSPTDELAFQRWWQQSFPGLNNQIRWNDKGKTWQMRNFWAFLADFDGAMSRKKALVFEVPHVAVDAPTGLVATASADSVRLGWKKPAKSKVDGYNIFRSEKRSGGFERVNLTLHKDLTYVDTSGLMAGRIYYYQVKTVGSAGIQSEAGPIEGVRFGQS
jgi:hypothetical protein